MGQHGQGHILEGPGRSVKQLQKCPGIRLDHRNGERPVILLKRPGQSGLLQLRHKSPEYAQRCLPVTVRRTLRIQDRQFFRHKQPSVTRHGSLHGFCKVNGST